MDRRQRKSRAAIFSALNKLLCEKSYSGITVQEIINEADVGRTTFYAHFPTKDDMLTELSKEIFSHVFSDAPGGERTHDFSSAAKDPVHLITHMLYHIRDNTMDISRIVSSDGSAIFLRYFRSRFSDYLGTIIDEDAISPVPKDYLTCQISQGLVSTIEWWISKGMVQKPEEVAGFFMKASCSLLLEGQEKGIDRFKH